MSTPTISGTVSGSFNVDMNSNPGEGWRRRERLQGFLDCGTSPQQGPNPALCKFLFQECRQALGSRSGRACFCGTPLTRPKRAGFCVSCISGMQKINCEILSAANHDAI